MGHKKNESQGLWDTKAVGHRTVGHGKVGHEAVGHKDSGTEKT